MENKVYETETIWNIAYILNSLWQIFNILLLIIIVYYLIKLYRKLIKYLDRDS
jgi:uncharacterized membrane protein